MHFVQTSFFFGGGAEFKVRTKSAIGNVGSNVYICVFMCIYIYSYTHVVCMCMCVYNVCIYIYLDICVYVVSLCVCFLAVLTLHGNEEPNRQKQQT